MNWVSLNTDSVKSVFPCTYVLCLTALCAQNENAQTKYFKYRKMVGKKKNINKHFLLQLKCVQTSDDF